MHKEGGKKYPAFSIFEKNELMRRFYSMKLLAGGSVKEHIAVMKQLLNDICLAGHDIDEELVIHVFLYSLPDSWDDFVGTLFAIKNTAGLTFDSLCQALEYEEDRRATKRKEAERTSPSPR